LECLDEGRPTRSGVRLSVDEGLPGRAFRRQEVLAAPDGDKHRVYLPVTIRADRLGVLDVVVPSPPSPDVLTRLRHAATALAYVIAAARPYTDVFERVRRYKRLELAAEIQWGLLPALAYEGDELTLAGMLEPAYEFGGDNFDYAVEEGAITLSVTDAMGHGLSAAVVGSLAVNAMRNARRSGADLVGQAEAANDALSSQFGGNQFVSGLLIRVDLDSGEMTAVDAGHPSAFRIRDGRVEELTLDPDFPFGIFADSTYRAQSLAVERGDRLVVISDGVIEASPDVGEQFGPERLIGLLEETAALSPPEVVRLITRAVSTHRATDLKDDATVLCVDRTRSPHRR
jgi:serine phosphatase RsbU (regulator of sigma subunit)